MEKGGSSVRSLGFGPFCGTRCCPFSFSGQSAGCGRREQFYRGTASRPMSVRAVECSAPPAIPPPPPGGGGGAVQPAPSLYGNPRPLPPGVFDR